MPKFREGSRQWMAWLSDQVCPKCGGEITGLRKGPCPCAEALPCGHRVLGGADAMDRVRDLWGTLEPNRSVTRVESRRQ